MPSARLKPWISGHLHAQKRTRSSAEEAEQCHADEGTQALELETVEQTHFYNPVYSKKYLWTCVLSASIGGNLFGYDTGVISSAVVLFHSDLGHTLDKAEKIFICTWKHREASRRYAEGRPQDAP